MSRNSEVFAGGVPAEQWRRVHPVSPVLNTWQVFVALLAFLLYQNVELIRELNRVDFVGDFGAVSVLLIVAGVLIAIMVIVGLYSYFSWRRTSFAVTDQAVWFRSGIFFRTERHARLERIQAVDIIHPLLGRIFGLGKISIEVAGSADSSLTFGFLKTSELTPLRAEIMARAAGVYSANTSVPSTHRDQNGQLFPAALPLPDQPIGHHPASPARSDVPAITALEAPERELYSVPVGMLLGSLLLSGGVMFTLVLLLAVVVTAVVVGVLTGGRGLVGLFSIVPVVFGLVAVLWGRFAGEFNFRAAVSPDGIRVSRGLTETRRQTIPPRRVHAVSIRQPLLWRKFGWYRVTISQAGYGTVEEGSATVGTVLLPVGTRQEAVLALWLVLPDLGVDDPQAFIDEALSGVGPSAFFLPNPRRSRLFDPLVYRRRGLAITRTCVAVRDGRIYRRASFVPFERIQSLGVSQGPWQKRRQLATFAAHIVPGSVMIRVLNMDQTALAEAMPVIDALSISRRTAEPPEKWMQRIEKQVGPLVPPVSPVESAPLGVGRVNPDNGEGFSPQSGK